MVAAAAVGVRFSLLPEVSRKYQAVALAKRLSMGSQMQQLSAEDAIQHQPDASVDWADDEGWPYEIDD